MPRKHRQVYLKRLNRLRHRFDSIGCECSSLHDDAITSSTIIDLDNLVVQSFRQFAIQTVRQAQLSHTVPRFSTGLCSQLNYDQELAEARWRAAGSLSRHQPRAPFKRTAVRDPVLLEKDIRTLGFGATPLTLQNAIGIPNQPFKEIKHFRHFYAHRCDDTAIQLRNSVPQFVRSSYRHPDDYVRGYDYSSGTRIFDRWWGGVYNFLSVLL